MTNFKDKGVKAPTAYFVGEVLVNMNIIPEDNYNTMIGTVTFEPKGRTNWHTHTSGQILFIITGVGYYQEKGKPVQIIREGDIVKIPKNTEHWHGASHQNSMTHIAIVPDLDKDQTSWFEPVSEEEYNCCLQLEKEMNINLSDEAIKNHEELFPNYKSTLKITDPELIEIFDNFAFDEVLRYGNLDTKTRVMMILGSCIASQSQLEYKMMLNAALNVGVKPIEVKEILYQSVPYVGIAKGIDFVYITNEILLERGIQLPLERQSTTAHEMRMEKGLALQKEIFGEMIELMYKESPSNQIHIQEYLSANCFGDYYTRQGLNIKLRELLTFSMILSLGGCEPQLKGHIQGNLNIGNDKEILLSTITQLLPYVGYPRTLNAIRCLNELTPE